ncbi:MAG: putative phage abortive infection protein [Desulfuromonas sp.]|nr:putative phage abortive infection protein [Desulfuromonas sp.]
MKKLILFFLIVIAVVPLGLYFFNFGYGLSPKNSDWAAFGSYVGGVYGVMAFFAVAYSIYVTGVQFIKQNQDQVFYKSVDNLMSGIVNGTESSKFKAWRSHTVLRLVTDEILQHLTNQSSHLARKILCSDPTIISDTNIFKIVNSLTERSLGHDVKVSTSTFLNAISEQKDFNACWEWLKGILGGVDAENENIRTALQDAGCVSFYKVGFDDREYYYQMAWSEVEERHGEFINRYTKNIAFILSHIHEAQGRDIYIRYLISQLTKYDIVILFYFASLSNDGEVVRKLIDFGVLGEIKRYECRALMLDAPSEQEILIEIECIKQRVNNLINRTEDTSAT